MPIENKNQFRLSNLQNKILDTSDITDATTIRPPQYFSDFISRRSLLESTALVGIVGVVTISYVQFSVVRAGAKVPGCLDKQSMELRLKKVIIEHLGVEADKIKADTSYIDDLDVDSLDTVEILLAVEEEFGIEIQDHACENLVTVGDTVKFLCDS